MYSQNYRRKLKLSDIVLNIALENSPLTLIFWQCIVYVSFFFVRSFILANLGLKVDICNCTLGTLNIFFLFYTYLIQTNRASYTLDKRLSWILNHSFVKRHMFCNLNLVRKMWTLHVKLNLLWLTRIKYVFSQLKTKIHSNLHRREWYFVHIQSWILVKIMCENEYITGNMVQWAYIIVLFVDLF